MRGASISINRREWVVKNTISTGIVEELQNINMRLRDNLEEFVSMGMIFMKKTNV